MKSHYKIQILALLLTLFSVKLKSQCTTNFTDSLSFSGTVYFTNTSAPSQSVCSWIFGDGGTSSQVNPVHTYTANGTYQVWLSSPSCNSTWTANVVVNNAACNLVAGLWFSTSANGGVAFSNTSTGTIPSTTYTLDYGDGMVANGFASHSYAANGTYNAVLTAQNYAGCTSTYSASVTVSNATGCPVVANFGYNIFGGVVTFTNLSTGTTPVCNYSWNFGDGQVSTQQNPTNTYGGNGTYIVTLTTSDTLALCANSFSQTISITNYSCVLNAGIGISTNPTQGGYIYTNNTTTGYIGTTTYTIDFGDGTTSTSFTSHTYSASGNYTVSLSAYNSSICTSFITQVISISLPSCSFTSSFLDTVSNGLVYVYNTSTGTGFSTKYLWNFGNGNTSNQQNPGPQTFFNGSYVITLTLSDSLNPYCSSSTSTQSVIVNNSPCVGNPSFAMVKDTSSFSSIVWSAIPNYPFGTAAVSWNWGDGNSTQGFYPSHNYASTGYYNICMTVTLTCGTVTSTCMNSSIYKLNKTVDMAIVNVVPALVTGIKKVDPASAIVIFPNPANDFLSISSAPSDYKVIISDMLGNSVYVKEHNEGDSKIDLQSLRSGIYLIQMSGSDFHKTTKLVKE